jgi:hypothetical protein
VNFVSASVKNAAASRQGRAAAVQKMARGKWICAFSLPSKFVDVSHAGSVE